MKYLLLIIFLIGCLANAHAEDVSLKDLFQQALQLNELIKVSESQTQEKAEKFRQTWGSLLPTLGMNLSLLDQDLPPGGRGSGTQGAFRNPRQTTWKFVLSQPLFRGGAEYFNWHVASKNEEAQVASYNSAQRDLYKQTALGFYSVLSKEKDLEIVSNLLDLIEKRVSYLKARAKTGQSKHTDVLLALSQEAVTRAQKKAAETDFKKARTDFTFLTGLTSEQKLKDNDRIPSIEDQDYYLDKVLERPDLSSLKLLWEASENAVAVTRSGHFPTADFNANYYLKRQGVMEGADWDFTLSFSLPIFQGGVVQSQLRESVYKKNQAALNYMYAKRKAENDIKNIYGVIRGLLDQVQSINEARVLVEKNYEQIRRDYQVGVANNLEVLQAMNTLIDTKRTYYRTLYDLKSRYYELIYYSGQGLSL